MRLFPALLLVISAAVHALEIEDLKPGERYDPSVPRPGDLLPFEIGERHLRHDQLIDYLQRLAEASPRVAIDVFGRTHELRSQQLVVITDPDNHGRLEALRQQHIDYMHGRSDEPGPLIVWLGYSIHGDEASGSNAAPLVAYHLAASEAAGDWLKDTIVLIDPSLNPDGMGRFAQWVNGHRSKHPVADPVDREHVEAWPTGRYNHYWFDLNRDWLLLTHPESRNRVRLFQHWRPHVFGDFHEMGSQSTYFFQPGVPERGNPLTPAENFELTGRLAEFHARAFDALGQLYFSEETFDDFYFGKGSTYPDIQGSIGILFEQATVAGHLIDTAEGPVPFARAVRNHFTTSLSTLEGARAMADDLKRYQRRFIEIARQRADDADGGGLVFGDARDPHRTRAMAERFAMHGIAVYALAEEVRYSGETYRAGEAFVVPFDQPQYPLIEALIESRTTFEDTTFYDVSTWNFPRLFNLPHSRVRNVDDYLGPRFGAAAEAATVEVPDAYAYVLPWEHYLSPRALGRLLRAEVPVRVATERFSARVADQTRSFARGALVVPARGPRNGDRIRQVLKTIAAEDGVSVIAVNSGLTPAGVDLGSGSLVPLKPVKPLLLVGRGVNPTEAGEVWHLLDVRMHLPPVMVDAVRLGEVSLHDYTHLLMVDGEYAELLEPQVERIHRWIQSGGVLVASKKAAAWVTQRGLNQKKLPPPPAEETEPKPAPKVEGYRPYGEFDDYFSRTVIGGAIVRVDLDTTHPLAYGYHQPELAVFRNGTVFLKPSDNPYETPLRYGADPVISGYMGEARQKQLVGSAAVIATKVGDGAVVRFADNPNFRGITYGTNKLYMNALFFGQILQETPVPDTEERL